MNFAKNKVDLIKHIAKETLVNREDAKKALEAVLSGIVELLKEGKSLRFVDFGSFSVQDRAAAEGRNPRTGDVIQIPAYKKPVFRAGKGLKEAINQKTVPDQSQTKKPSVKKSSQKK